MIFLILSWNFRSTFSSSLPDVSFSSMKWDLQNCCTDLNAFIRSEENVFLMLFFAYMQVCPQKRKISRGHNLLFLTCYFYFLLIIMLIFTLHIHSDSGSAISTNLHTFLLIHALLPSEVPFCFGRIAVACCNIACTARFNYIWNLFSARFSECFYHI